MTTQKLTHKTARRETDERSVWFYVPQRTARELRKAFLRKALTSSTNGMLRGSEKLNLVILLAEMAAL